MDDYNMHNLYHAYSAIQAIQYIDACVEESEGCRRNAEPCPENYAEPGPQLASANTRVAILKHSVLACDPRFTQVKAVMDDIEADKKNELPHETLKEMALAAINADITLHGEGFARMTNAELARALMLPADQSVSTGVANAVESAETAMQEARDSMKRKHADEAKARAEYQAALAAWNKARADEAEGYAEFDRVNRRKTEVDRLAQHKRLADSVEEMAAKRGI